MSSTPILLSSCAKATTAAEARFRIDRAIRPARAARVFAMDSGAVGILADVATRPWATARFHRFTADDELQSLSGEPIRLESALEGADVVVMVATSADTARPAPRIGRFCLERGIMTAAVVLDDDGMHPAVLALRPFARVLMLTSDQNDVQEVLTALRA